MRILDDYNGSSIRLTDERFVHILEHPEMANMVNAIAETLLAPERVTRSLTDSEARLYYKIYNETIVGKKYLCVVVKETHVSAFVLTAYLTDKIKKGDLIWPKEL